MYESEETQDDLLSAYFEKSATAVRHSFGRFEKELVRPTVRYIIDSFQLHPIRSTLLTIYAALSALPILSFIGFTVFVFSSFIFLALCTALLAALVVMLFSGFWLACILVFLLFLSVPITASVLSVYLVLRLALISRQETSVRGAFVQWAKETKVRFIKGEEASGPEPNGSAEPHDESEGETLVVGSVVLDASSSKSAVKQDAGTDGAQHVQDAKPEVSS
ncbi:hypothetical protein C8Q70DRAFT_1058705 [Cubamyces menziesii]|uniref:Promethin n=1 Tax=Trametes cubensis TaxID=1111947 RepID=A0AAD7TU06_9APHY|nr:hypothetical protein C8Q70DRAFT_1058705 [Cubamyces menziesii]KAJ8475186.1 hypothetical protein ONZ51_g6718 [Trametes cubensis]